MEEKTMDAHMAFLTQWFIGGRGQGNRKGHGGFGPNNQFNSKGRSFVPTGQPYREGNTQTLNKRPTDFGQ